MFFLMFAFQNDVGLVMTFSSSARPFIEKFKGGFPPFPRGYVPAPQSIMHYMSYCIISNYESMGKTIILEQQITEFLSLRTFFLEKKATVLRLILISP